MDVTDSALGLINQSSNLVYKLTHNCTDCDNDTVLGDTTPGRGGGGSKDVLYIAFPIMIGLGVSCSLLNFLIITRQLRISNDSYMLGLTTSCALLLVCGGILRMPDYIGHNNTYQYMYGYVKTLNDWFWFTSLWIMLVMSLERSMTVTHNRSKSTCSITQALVVTVLLFCVCLVSALPQFWEYETVQSYDYGTNETIVISQTSLAAESPEYKIMYFWYTISITIFLPYPILFLLVILLSKGMKRSSHSRRRLSVKHGTAQILNRKFREEMHITRLFIVMILLYFLFTGPFAFMPLIERLVPQWVIDNENLHKDLRDIFEFAFYFYFSIQFLLYCSYSDKFRQTLLRTCCCCCDSQFACVKPKGKRSIMA